MDISSANMKFATQALKGRIVTKFELRMKFPFVLIVVSLQQHFVVYILFEKKLISLKRLIKQYASVHPETISVLVFLYRIYVYAVMIIIPSGYSNKTEKIITHETHTLNFAYLYISFESVFFEHFFIPITITQLQLKVFTKIKNLMFNSNHNLKTE